MCNESFLFAAVPYLHECSFPGFPLLCGIQNDANEEEDKAKKEEGEICLNIVKDVDRALWLYDVFHDRKFNVVILELRPPRGVCKACLH